MTESVLTRTFIYQEEDEIPFVDASDLITEDDTPVDNIFSERQMDLLTDCLYASWSGSKGDKAFIALSNVALYYTPHEDALVPDVLVSLGVRLPADVWEKANRSYLIWEYGKPPEIVVEIVSNRKGRELSYKMEQYARLGITYYLVFDPLHQLSSKPLRIYALKDARYQENKKEWLSGVGLGVTLWEGNYRGLQAVWLRWRDEDGRLLLTGEERAERLAAQLRALGIEPEA
jgi:Uma2 family endonuclease